MDETRFPPKMSVLFSIFEAAIYRNFLNVFLGFGCTLAYYSLVKAPLADNKGLLPSWI